MMAPMESKKNSTIMRVAVVFLASSFVLYTCNSLFSSNDAPPPPPARVVIEPQRAREFEQPVVTEIDPAAPRPFIPGLVVMLTQEWTTFMFGMPFSCRRFIKVAGSDFFGEWVREDGNPRPTGAKVRAADLMGTQVRLEESPVNADGTCSF